MKVRLYRCLFLIFLCVLSARASAQNIYVESFRLDEKDLTANQQGTIVLDQNGEKCALIKIRTTQQNFSFDVGSLGVMDTQQKVGEIWLYVPHGVRKLTMHHQHLGTCEYTFPSAIVKARTYIMQLTTGEVQTIVRNAVTAQYVMFNVSPKNATVELNGETLETSDGIASKRMPFGTYSYRVQAPRHAPEAGTVLVSDPKNKHTVNVTLAPQFSTFTFSVDNNAEIWINEQKSGTGTCSVELGYGVYLVECRLAGHRPSRRELTLGKENCSQPIQLNAPSPIYGSIDINSTPGNAEVWLDGKQIGTTPMFVSEILACEHELEIKKSGYKSNSSKVNIEEGATKEVMITLEKGTSQDSIYSVPEIPASFPGGHNACGAWITNNLRYPPVCMENGIQGKVNVSFVVEKDGSISDIKVLRSPDEHLSKEAVRVIQSMPKWKPAYRGNQPVRSAYSIPITFSFRQGR